MSDLDHSWPAYDVIDHDLAKGSLRCVCGPVVIEISNLLPGGARKDKVILHHPLVPWNKSWLGSVSH